MPPSLERFAMTKHEEGYPQELKPKTTKKATRLKYKKAPGAPRRFKSAYMFFSTEKHRFIRDELTKDGKSEKTTSIAKMVSKAWKALSQDERDQWEERASQDKARYEVEKTMYTGPWKVPAKKRTAKDPNAPKRPMSAFLSFSHAKRSEVKDSNPTKSNAEISRVLAQMWKEAPEEDKKSHVDQEFTLRQEYKSAIAIWRDNSEREIAQQRKSREDIALRTVAANKGAVTADSDENLRGKSLDDQAGGSNDSAYPYSTSQYSQYPQDMYPPYGGVPSFYPPYPPTGSDPRDLACGFPANEGYGNGPPPSYGYYQSYNSDIYGPSVGYGNYPMGGGGGYSSGYLDYLPSSGQHGAYPSYHGAGQDVRLTQPEESKWNGENSHSPARNLSSLTTHGRLPPATGHAKHK